MASSKRRTNERASGEFSLTTHIARYFLSALSLFYFSIFPTAHTNQQSLDGSARLFFIVLSTISSLPATCTFLTFNALYQSMLLTFFARILHHSSHFSFILAALVSPPTLLLSFHPFPRSLPSSSPSSFLLAVFLTHESSRSCVSRLTSTAFPR